MALHFDTEPRVTPTEGVLGRATNMLTEEYVDILIVGDRQIVDYKIQNWLRKFAPLECYVSMQMTPNGAYVFDTYEIPVEEAKETVLAINIDSIKIIGYLTLAEDYVRNNYN